MSILIDNKTRVIVQGITGEQGRFHTGLMLEYGTKIVAGVTPGRGGQMIGRVPVFDTVNEAMKFCQADYSIIFVPAKNAMAAALEALESGLNIVIITEHLPIHDAMMILEEARKRKLTVIGPNCPGIITPGQCKIGIMPSDVFVEGSVGIISRSGTLTYEIADNLRRNGIGQSTVIGIGGDFINGLNFEEALSSFEKDKKTKAVVMIGEIGGDAEERAANFIKKKFSKPVIAYIAGKTAPEGKTMGHAGAIISGNTGTYLSKITALKKAGATIADTPWHVPDLLKKIKPGIE
ncbi:succinate--CoA ligase subunit alpha [Candidatus Gracilibacteria bacterium]|nr:succinate--CoA ligase subunit alpha [Candidatus Gracilibacteria bacterium]